MKSLKSNVSDEAKYYSTPQVSPHAIPQAAYPYPPYSPSIWRGRGLPFMQKKEPY